MSSEGASGVTKTNVTPDCAAVCRFGSHDLAPTVVPPRNVVALGETRGGSVDGHVWRSGGTEGKRKREGDLSTRTERQVRKARRESVTDSRIKQHREEYGTSTREEYIDYLR